MRNVLSCAVEIICSISSLFLKVGSGNNLFIDLALVISLFNIVTIVSSGLPLNYFSDLSKYSFLTFTAGMTSDMTWYDLDMGWYDLDRALLSYMN